MQDAQKVNIAQCIQIAQLPCCPSAPAAAAAAALAARRAASSGLHMRLCPARQSACEQAVPQYHTARQALHAAGQQSMQWSAGTAGAQRAQRQFISALFSSTIPSAICHDNSQPPAHLHRMLPTPCPAARPPSPPRLAQRR